MCEWIILFLRKNARGDSGDMVRHLFLKRKSVFGSTLMSATEGE